jgi:hypothetical protein
MTAWLAPETMAHRLPAWTIPWLIRLSLYCRAIAQAHDRQAHEAERLRRGRLPMKGTIHVKK